MVGIKIRGQFSTRQGTYRLGVINVNTHLLRPGGDIKIVSSASSGWRQRWTLNEKTILITSILRQVSLQTYDYTEESCTLSGCRVLAQPCFLLFSLFFFYRDFLHQSSLDN